MVLSKTIHFFLFFLLVLNFLRGVVMVIEFVCVLFLTLCLIENFHGFCLFPWKVVFSWRVGITFLCLLRGGKKKHFRGSICVGCNYCESNWVLNVLQSVSPAETSIFYCKFLFVSLESDSPRKKKGLYLIPNMI